MASGERVHFLIRKETSFFIFETGKNGEELVILRADRAVLPKEVKTVVRYCKMTSNNTKKMNEPHTYSGIYETSNNETSTLAPFLIIVFICLSIFLKRKKNATGL